MDLLTFCDEISKFVTHVTFQHEFQLSPHPTTNDLFKKNKNEHALPLLPHP
jgi:hypothetical protein